MPCIWNLREFQHKVPGPAWLLLAYPLPPGDPYSPTLTYFSMLEDISAYSQILMRHGTKCLNSSTSKSSDRANTLCAGRTPTIPHHLSYYTHKIAINYLSFHFYPSTIPLSSLIISLFIMTSPPHSSPSTLHQSDSASQTVPPIWIHRLSWFTPGL